MKYKFYHISALSPEQAEADLNQFCSQHHVLKTEREFVADGSNSFWSICLMYSNNSVTPFTGNEGRKNRVDYKEILSEADFVIYSGLRDLRKQIADREGTAVYNIFTNGQLSEMVEQRLTSKEMLSKIKGVGAAKLEKYAEEFVAHLVEQFALKKAGKPEVNEA